MNGCVFLKLGESIYVEMDLIPIRLGLLPLAHNAQHSLVVVKSHLFPQFALAGVEASLRLSIAGGRAPRTRYPGGTAAVNRDGWATHQKRGGGGSYTHNSDSDSQ